MSPENLITTDELNELLTAQEKQVTDYIAEGEKEGIPPIIVVIERQFKPVDGKIEVAQREVPIGIKSKSDEDFDRNKEAIIQNIGVSAAEGAKLDDSEPVKNVAVAAFMISEAWQLNLKDDELKELESSDKRIRDYDDKVEVAIVVGMTTDGRNAFSSMRIVRDEDDKIIGLTPFKRVEANDENSHMGEASLLRNFFVGYRKRLIEKSEERKT